MLGAVTGAIVCLMTVSGVDAVDAIVWRRDLPCEPNSACSALIIDKKGKEAIVLGTSKDAGKTSRWVWRVDASGTLRQARSLGLMSERESFSTRVLGTVAAVRQKTGDIVRWTGPSGDDTNGVSLGLTGRDKESRSILVPLRRGGREDIVFHDMDSNLDGTVLLVGQRDSNGVILKIDSGGILSWERQFTQGQSNILTSLAGDPGSNDLYATGVSVKMAGKMSFAGPSTVWLLRYNGDGTLVKSDSFVGGTAPWPGSMPKVTCLSCGIVVVVYDRGENGRITELRARIYSPDMDLIHDQELLKTKEGDPPSFYDLCASPDNRFVFAGVTEFENLHISEYSAEGTCLQKIELPGEVRGIRVYVQHFAGQILVAYAKAGGQDKQTEGIRVLAIRPQRHDPSVSGDTKP